MGGKLAFRRQVASIARRIRRFVAPALAASSRADGAVMVFVCALLSCADTGVGTAHGPAFRGLPGKGGIGLRGMWGRGRWR